VQWLDASPVAAVLARRLTDCASLLADAREAVRTDDPHWLRQILARLSVRRPPRRAIGRLLGVIRAPIVAWSYRGMSVALLGPDGAGKSTLAQCLREEAFFPARVIYMGTGISGELTARPKPLRVLRGPLLFSLGGVATQWVRYLQGFAQRLRGRMVIFDRYTEEALLPPKPFDPAWRRAGRAVRRRLVCPPPELAIVLDAAGTVMYSRKGEHDAAKLEVERERYRALVMVLPHVIVVDAQQAPAAVCSQAMAGIWETYRRRFQARPTASRERGPSDD
jgi:thymidylate kinase